MTPLITKREDLLFIDEDVDEDTGELQHTTFAYVDKDDNAYFGKLNCRKSEPSFEELSSTLTRIPDATLFPQWNPESKYLTETIDDLPLRVYIKRPQLRLFDTFQKHNVLHLLPAGLLQEAKTMEELSKYPHPNVIRYYGCRVRGGYITGLVLDSHPHTLTEYLRDEPLSLNKGPFMAALESAIHHLHTLGWAHNDLNPSNVFVDDIGARVLIDFGSAHRIGANLGTSRGTNGWIDGGIEDYDISDPKHDVSALKKIRAWLENPVWRDDGRAQLSIKKKEETPAELADGGVIVKGSDKVFTPQPASLMAFKFSLPLRDSKSGKKALVT